MKLRALSFVVVACVGLSPHRTALAQGIPCSYSVTVLPEVDCGVFNSPGNPAAINNLGHVLLTAACGEYDRTYLWTGGDTLTPLPLPPGALNFTATDLNDVGQAVGYGWQPPGGGMRGYIYDLNTGEWTELPPLNPPNGWSGANAITNDGRVCGFRSIGSKGDPINPTTAFIWTPNLGFSDLGVLDGRSTRCEDINNHGLASASNGFAIDPGVMGYLWDGAILERIGPIPGGLTSGAGRVNDRGWMFTAGAIQINPLIIRTYLRMDTGVFIELPPLSGGVNAGLISLTDAGVVSGQTNFAGEIQRATIWRNAQPIAVRTLISDTFKGTLVSARMNNREEILAIGQDERGDDRLFLLTPAYAAAGDTNCDQIVNIDDLLAVIGMWGPCAGCTVDLTRDGAVNIFDLVGVIQNWGATGGAT